MRIIKEVIYIKYKKEVGKEQSLSRDREEQTLFNRITLGHTRLNFSSLSGEHPDGR